MKARIIERKWVQAWFDERQCNHMPSLTLANDGRLLAIWTGMRGARCGSPVQRMKVKHGEMSKRTMGKKVAELT